MLYQWRLSLAFLVFYNHALVVAFLRPPQAYYPIRYSVPQAEPWRLHVSDLERYEDKGVAAAHGRHICLDYTGFYLPARESAALTLRIMRDAVRNAGVREVHHQVVVLGDDGRSPPGFTGVVLIDESHVTAHCYSDRGWLAVDVFTCGSHPPELIAEDIHKNLLSNVPTLKLMGDVRLPRFLHEKVNVNNNKHADTELHQLRYNTTGSGTQGEYVYV